MTSQDLKNAILQLAVQGKLVPQDPNDEPASELLKRIEAEKAALIKAGRIKKDKTLTDLSADDLPFDIPESWRWLKLGSICQLMDGEKKKGISYPYLEAKFLRGKAAATMLNEGKYVTKGTRLILVDGENSGEVFSATEDGYMGSTFKVLFFPQELFAGYVLYFLQFKQLAFRNNKTGSAIPHLNKELFFNMPFPVPPLAEQKRIVAKIEELMPLVEEYGKAEERLTALNAEFPDKLRKSILQQAIQGKLTERDPADEPASELLKHIRAEKERLIKEGKIKKEKPLPPITEEEMPFEIPENWEYVYLSELATGQITYGIIKLGEEDPHGVKVLRCSDVKPGWINPAGIRTVKKSLSDDYSRTILQGGEIVINVRGTLGGCAIVPNDFAGYNVAREVAVLPLTKQISMEFILFVLLSPMFDQYLTNNLRGVAYKGLNIELLSSLLVPLPPLAEQQRIVERVNELLALCDGLKY